MDARLIPVVLPVAKKVIQLQKFKEELKRVSEILDSQYSSEDDDYTLKYRAKTMNRYKERLAENIAKLEKELSYGDNNRN